MHGQIKVSNDTRLVVEFDQDALGKPIPRAMVLTPRMEAWIAVILVRVPFCACPQGHMDADFG